MSKKQATRNTTEPEPEELTALDTDTDVDSDTDTDTETETKTETATNSTTFPLTRTFIHCDSTGRELAHVTLTATVTLTRLSGVVLTVNEIERRFRRNFYLSFKGGKASGVHVSATDATATQPRSRRTLSPEHKQKLQEARQRRREGSEKAKAKQDEEAHCEIVKLATTLLNGFSKLEQSEGSAWFGKAAILSASGIVGNASWTLAIRYLLDTGQIEARGEKRGREYRIAKERTNR